MKAKNIIRIVDGIILIGRLSIIGFGIFALASFMAGKSAEILIGPVTVIGIGNIILMFMTVVLLKYYDKKILEEQK